MPPPRSWTSTSPSIPRCSAGTQRSGRDRQYSAGSWFPTSRPLGPPPEPDLRPDRRNAMGAPSPELCNLWLARAFNAQDLDAAAAMYHPDASIVRVGEVHDATSVARGSQGIRETMAGYVGLRPPLARKSGV